jgi:branched-chain amino acid transport system substrate-binding protein
MRKFVRPLMFLVIVFVMIFAGCAQPSAPSEPTTPTTPTTPTEDDEWSWVVADEWYFPALDCLTGWGAMYGQHSLWGKTTAVEEINAAGGIAGKPIRFEARDEMLDPDKCKSEMAKILANDPLMVGGPLNDRDVASSVPLAIDQGVFCMVNATGTSVAMQYSPWTYSSTDTSENEYRPGVLAWIKRRPDIKSVVPLVTYTEAMWTEVSEVAMDTLAEAGIETMEGIDVPHETVNHAAMATKALASGADGFWLGCDGATNAKLIIELEARGMTDKGKIMVFAAGEPNLFEVGEGYLDGVYLQSYYWPQTPLPRWQALLEKWYAENPGIDPVFTMHDGYDQIYLFKAAIENCKITGDPAKLAEERLLLRDYIRNVKDFPFVMGTSSVYDGVKRTTQYLFVIENNQKVLQSRLDIDGNDIPLD